MPSLNVSPPNLPSAPNQYDARFHDQFSNVLRIFFTSLANKVNTALSYGSFYDTTTQTNPVANAVNLMKWNSVYSLGTSTVFGVKRDTNRIYVSQAGIYNIQFSAQLDKTGGGAATFYIWIRVNGQAVKYSATKMVIAGPNDEKVASWNWILTLSANDYFEIAWSSSSTDAVLLAEPAAGNVPDVPSVIVTVSWVSGLGV